LSKKMKRWSRREVDHGTPSFQKGNKRLYIKPGGQHWKKKDRSHGQLGRKGKKKTEMGQLMGRTLMQDGEKESRFWEAGLKKGGRPGKVW